MIARFREGEESNPAVFLYFIKQTELAQRKERSAEEWKNAVSGIADSVDEAGKKVAGSPCVARAPRKPSRSM